MEIFSRIGLTRMNETHSLVWRASGIASGSNVLEMITICFPILDDVSFVVFFFGLGNQFGPCLGAQFGAQFYQMG